MNNLKMFLQELLIILVGFLGAVVGLFLGMNYGGNYGFEPIFGLYPGYEGAGTVGLILGAVLLAGVRIYFHLNNMKRGPFGITLLSFLVGCVIANWLFYLELTYFPGRAIALATILLLPLAGLFIPTIIFKQKMKGNK